MSRRRIPENVDMLIELLQDLIRPIPKRGILGQQVTPNFTPLTRDGKLVHLDLFPRILDPHMTNYFINQIKNNVAIRSNFVSDYVLQALTLVYDYARSLSKVQCQMIPQPMATLRMVNNRNVREIKYYDHRDLTDLWPLKSPKYYNYNFHVSINRYDPSVIAAQQREMVVSNLRRIKFREQKRSYLRHLELVGDKVTTAFPKKFTKLQRLNWIVDTDDEDDLPQKTPTRVYKRVQRFLTRPRPVRRV